MSARTRWWPASASLTLAARVGVGDVATLEVGTYPTFTSGLETLADWLQAEGVTQVVMEATGQYWKPIWYVLEERGLELLLVNARHVKICPAARPTSAMPPGLLSCWSVGCCGAAACPRLRSASYAT
jgi:Transposase